MTVDVHSEPPPEWWHRAVDLRRHLHQHPELRFEERATARLLAERLRAAGYAVTTQVGGTGVVATIDRGPGRQVLLRADMDALSVPDGKDVPYRSRTDGVTHACGHDIHMAVMVTVAELLAGDGDWDGRITVLLQPAEEIPYGEASGAQAVLDTGTLDLNTVDAVIGMHCWPSLPSGTIGIDEHVAMAAKDAFRIEVQGRGSHAASPAEGRDAILAASHIVTFLHQLVGRQVDPSSGAALNVGTIAGGRGQSVVPDTAEIVGTLRTTDEAVRERLRKAMEQVCHGVCLATDTESTFEWANAMPSVRNDAELKQRSIAALATVPSLRVRRLDSSPMTTDDFALYAERAPSLYFKLGTCGTASGCAPLHSSTFDVDERAIEHGVRAVLAITHNELRPDRK